MVPRVVVFFPLSLQTAVPDQLGSFFPPSFFAHTVDEAVAQRARESTRTAAAYVFPSGVYHWLSKSCASTNALHYLRAKIANTQRCRSSHPITQSLDSDTQFARNLTATTAVTSLSIEHLTTCTCKSHHSSPSWCSAFQIPLLAFAVACLFCSKVLVFSPAIHVHLSASSLTLCRDARGVCV